MPYRFTSSFPYLLNRVGVRMGELFSRKLAAHDLTLPMYRVMAVLRQEGAQRLSDLSAMVTVEISTLSRLVTAMKRKGLVSRVRPEDNGRTVRIDLTKAGEKLVDDLMPIAAHFEEVGIKTFSHNEVAWLKNALKQIHDNLQDLDRTIP
ncbi:MarR family winged helix-turn-helix transcriptional regulator [Allomesorhizobium camelthorni]|uniref:MarR family transcriptional regulator n=1 Tax=Allomesorhizobium camelthorni TaxID=475069 RepID=A0A6G4WEY0_9HYPH|nr:MarR family transcriptional regulator [Mesorhizobium camelthorni]NGO52786.1 MarR family transcriptional regulator [Mesorhizobium camelthorni]